MASDGSAATKFGHALAKGLGIDLHYRNPTDAERITRGESVYSVSSADQYIEEEPSVTEWFREIIPTGKETSEYLWSLFPFTHWILSYNAQWLVGDLIAGITVGCVVVPQSMAYALLANLKPEYGLYSSFMGVLIYWFFATSKDITIGPVAVLSTVTGNVITTALAYDKTLDPADIAAALAIICGSVVLFLGLIRLGWIVNFISLAAISAFMTGSAINIAAGQVANLLGEKGFDTRASTYLVIINSLKFLPQAKLDAAIGLTALFLLYLIRWTCGFLARKMPQHARAFFFANTLRTAFVILLYTLVGWKVCEPYRLTPKKMPIKILLDVPRGFQHAHVPNVNSHLIKSFLGEIPATVIVMLIEHIAIAKSFGRVNNYTINPSQELVAIGVTNVLGPFLGAYPATGSFSRTAIKAKAGVRTPFAGVITALLVLLALYALPPVFYYIPNAVLSAVIIHAVGDLITPPNTVYQFWLVSPLDVVIFFAGVIVTIFTTIEIGIYVTMISSVVVLLWRTFLARGRFLGRVKVHSVIGDHLIEGRDSKPRDINEAPTGDPDTTTRNIFLPIIHDDGSNPEIDVKAPYPGVFIFRFTEGFNYPNSGHYFDDFVEYIFKNTQRTNKNPYKRRGDRPWNDPGPRHGKVLQDEDTNLPELKAIILDFSAVNNVDITSVQTLIDIRNQLDRYTAPNRVDWHFAHINNRWTKRALASAGFGYPAPPDEHGTFQRWKPIFSVAEIGGDASVAAQAERELERSQVIPKDIESHAQSSGVKDEDGITRVDQHQGTGNISLSSGEDGVDAAKRLAQSKAVNLRRAVVYGISRPLFHPDLTSALQSAVANVEKEQVQLEQYARYK